MEANLILHILTIYLNFPQTLPVVELKRKNKTLSPDISGDFSNDNNVWRPKAENQIRKSGVRHRETTKTNDNDVFPSDVIIRKARDVGKLKRVANEKSRDDVKRVDERQREELVTSTFDVLAALGRIGEFEIKISQYIDFLREIVEDPPEMEDINDLRKRQKRATEFSNRFARNHLYQIGRIVSLENATQFVLLSHSVSSPPCYPRRQKKFASCPIIPRT